MRQLREALESALFRLGSEAGTDLALNADGVVAIQLSDDVQCSIEMPEHSDHIHLHAPVMTLSPSDPRGVLEGAMARNLFGLAPPTAWLAWEAGTRTVLLCAGMSADGLSDERLRDLLIEFHAEVVECRRVLGDGAGRIPSAVEPAAAADDMIVLRL